MLTVCLNSKKASYSYSDLAKIPTTIHCFLHTPKLQNMRLEPDITDVSTHTYNQFGH